MGGVAVAVGMALSNPAPPFGWWLWIARPDSEEHRYYQNLKTRRKTHREALRVLKRRSQDRIWTHLQPPKPARV